MANPQIDSGKWFRIANSIQDALCGIRIPGEARQCLDVILRKTYGFNKKKDRIPLVQFCLLTRLPKPSVSRGLAKLLEMNLIVKNDNKNGITYMFNKDFDTWKPLTKTLTLTKTLIGVNENVNASLTKTLIGVNKNVNPTIKDISSKDNSSKDISSKDRVVNENVNAEDFEPKPDRSHPISDPEVKMLIEKISFAGDWARMVQVARTGEWLSGLIGKFGAERVDRVFDRIVDFYISKGIHAPEPDNARRKLFEWCERDIKYPAQPKKEDEPEHLKYYDEHMAAEYEKETTTTSEDES